MKNKTNELSSIGSDFPALKRKIKGKPVVFFDGPGGTQVPGKVINAISDYYRYHNANSHGFFITSKETDKIIETARENMSVFLGAEGKHTISIGQNMTSLNYSLSRAFGKMFMPGDEIVITQLDHESNRSPWLQLQESGIEIRQVKLLPDGTLDYSDFESKINERTKLVAMGWASNALGTVNDIARIRKLTYQANALLLVDAVHYAPHFSIDVQQMGMDFLLCSSYKFYGPHLGFLYSKPGFLDSIPTERLRTQEQHAPYSIETGTLNHASIAGVNATIDFLASMGVGNSKREKLTSAYGQITEHEQKLAKYLYEQLGKNASIHIVGPDFKQDKRAPTISFTHKTLPASEVCKRLGEKGITAWDGHFYAIKAIEVLGLLERGGVTRVGISIYNTKENIDYLIASIKDL